ncbi:MAG: hypothetical protein K2Z81_24700 [Cyanobacteria bacterium]|nr:hypothetical protein [Cyanobacteriota bacterium]
MARKLLSLVLLGCGWQPVFAQSPEQVPPTANLQQTASESGQFKYIGNNFSQKFHRPKCPFAEVMRHSRRVYCRFRCDAVALGYRPCKYCLPQRWTTVRAQILNPQPFDPGCAGTNAPVSGVEQEASGPETSTEEPASVSPARSSHSGAQQPDDADRVQDPEASVEANTTSGR